MGDKERSMEIEKEEQKEIKTVLHCPPLYPLPDEIKKMERSETVCCYCGVSYLIFNEFHQLNTQLAQQEAELQELRETAQREKTQREALELDRLEWEKALQMQQIASEKEMELRDEMEEKTREMERTLREGFDEKTEGKRREVEEQCQKISEEKERQLRRELEDLEAKHLRKQREELERRIEEREKVLSDALQKANKNIDKQRKYLQQLEEGLAAAASVKAEAEHSLRREKEQSEILRHVRVQQQQTLRATLSMLRSSSSDLIAVRGFLTQLMGAWESFRSKILQQSTQVSSVLIEEVKHSSEELEKIREEKEHLTQQLMEQRRQREEQLSHQDDSEKEHKKKLLRLKEELEEKHERWLSCQRKCDTIQEQLLLWQQREEQMNQRCSAAEEEVTQLGKALEKVQQETRELRRQREILIESHGRVLTKMEEDSRHQIASKMAAALEEQRTQNALQLKEQMETFRSDLELELLIDREKNQLLLLQYQQDSTQLQQKLNEREQELQGVRDKLQQEMRSREQERRKQEEKGRRREEELHQEVQHSQQQEALHLSQAKAELQQMSERNAELQEEVVLLQETVRRECEEREELTAALCKAQEELLGLRSQAFHHGSSSSPPSSMERLTPSANKHFNFHNQTRMPLARSSISPNTLRPFLACTDMDRSCDTDRRGAVRRLDSWNYNRVLGGEIQQEGTLPGVKASSTVNKVKHKVSLVMERKARP